MAIFFCGLFVCAAQAQELNQEDKETLLRNSAQLQFSSNDMGSRSSALAFEFFVQDKLIFNFGGGTSRLKSENDNAFEKTSQNYYLGLDYILNRRLETGLLYDVWGLKDVLTYKSVFWPVRYIGSRIDFELRLGGGEISFETNTPTIHSVVFDDRSTQISLGITLIRYLRIGYSHESHSYESARGYDISDLSGPFVSLLFSDDTISLVSSINKKQNSIEISYAFERFDIGIEFGVSESAFDGAKTRFSDLFGHYDIDSRWTVGASMGASRSDRDADSVTLEDDAPTKYASLSARYRF
jgi:hypothetical protein